MRATSLSARISALLLVTSLIVLGGGAMLMDWRIDHEMEARYRETLLAQARAAAAVVELERGAPGGDSAARPPASLFGGEGQAYYELRCSGAPPVRSDPAPPVLPDGWPDATGAQPQYSRLKYHGKRLGSVMFAFRGEPGESAAGNGATRDTRHCALLFQQDRRPFEQILIALDWILALSPVLALGIALIAVPLIVRRGLRPVARLAGRMSDVGPHAPGQRLAASGLHELDPLVQRFNEVLERMDEGLARERQFASGLAHETRTRLAELRVLTEVEARYPSGRSLPQLLGEIGNISAELEATVTALLLLTRLQGGLEQPQPQPLALEPWLERLAQRHRPAAEARGVGLQLSCGSAGELRTDPALLEVVLGNLLGNACAYAPSGDTVRVQVDAHGVGIDNAAPSLHPEDLPSLGQRFWRKQPQHAGHAGLGLALAYAAAGALGMRLEHRLDGAQRLHARLSW
jgi:signal transduction histidine kinase